MHNWEREATVTLHAGGGSLRRRVDRGVERRVLREVSVDGGGECQLEAAGEVGGGSAVAGLVGGVPEGLDQTWGEGHVASVAVGWRACYRRQWGASLAVGVTVVGAPG